MNSPRARLSGQVVWISGGASGIGAATAALFAEEGACVAIADRQADLSADVVSRICANGGRAAFFPADVTRATEVQRSIDSAVAQFGSLQIVVNCAGIVHAGPLHEYSEADWDILMAVNVKSIFFALKHAWPHLKQHARSYMVNIGSISSFIGQAATPAYTASKGAVLQLTKSIALDYAGQGLRCNCVCPGITDTPMLRHHLNKTADPESTLLQRLQRVPLGRALRPADVAKAVLYLSCEDSAGVTGTSLLVDGGYLAAAEWRSEVRATFENQD